MTYPAAHCHCGHEGYSLKREYTYTQTTSVRSQNSDLENSSTLAISQSSTYHYSETRYTPSDYEQKPVYKLDNQHVEAAAAESNTSPDNDANIAMVLAFVEQQLSADQAAGLDKDGLQEQLQKGYDGFLQGYNEAVSLLESMGLFEGEVKQAVERMLSEVVLGFAELADKFGLENPAAAETEAVDEVNTPALSEAIEQAPAVVAPKDIMAEFIQNTQMSEAESLQNLITPSQNFYSKLDAEESSSRVYSFRLRTTDGDLVTIRSYSDEGTRFQKAEGPNGNTEQFDIDGMDDFRFSVQGELDADELSAITNLLSQLNDVAETFFEGDVYSAFEQAQDIGYDSDEIARFALNLNQTSYSRLENTYGTIAKADTDNLNIRGSEPPAIHHPFTNKMAHFGGFMQMLEQIRQQAEKFTLPPQHLMGFANFVGEQRFGHHPHFPHFQAFMEKMTAA